MGGDYAGCSLDCCNVPLGHTLRDAYWWSTTTAQSARRPVRGGPGEAASWATAANPEMPAGVSWNTTLVVPVVEAKSTRSESRATLRHVAGTRVLPLRTIAS